MSVVLVTERSGVHRHLMVEFEGLRADSLNLTRVFLHRQSIDLSVKFKHFEFFEVFFGATFLVLFPQEMVVQKS